MLADLADYAFTPPDSARLEVLRLAAVEARIDADLALGRHDVLIGELEQLVAEYPLRERLHGQLMLAPYRRGRQADALAAYRRVRDLLAEELGVDPGEPLQHLHASVLAHDPALDWHGSRRRRHDFTFTLRRGIRYSNGVLVRASDFCRGIQRQLTFGQASDYYEGILGAQACHQHPQRCGLSAGIVTNDTARTVTFHLRQADPDFLYKLALIFAAPAPPGSPDHAISRAPFLRGTGPYMISQYRPDVSFTEPLQLAGR